MVLNNGTVLILGGQSTFASTADSGLTSAEVFDPATETFTNTGSMSTPQDFPQAFLLSDGRVAAIGNALGPVQIYSPLTGTWNVSAVLPSVFDPRSLLIAAKLPDDRIWVGQYSINTIDAVAVFSPGTGTWSAGLNPLLAVRDNAQATVLPTGKLWVFGGITSTGTDQQPQTGTEVYDPTALGGMSTSGPALSEVGGSYFAATTLPNGNVLVTGGFFSGQSHSATAIYSSNSNSVTLGPAMLIVRSSHSATLLTSGQVLVAGGYSATGTPVQTAELLTVAPNSCHPPESISSHESPSLTGLLTAKIDNVHTDLQNALSGSIALVNGLHWWLEVSALSVPSTPQAAPPDFLPDLAAGAAGAVAKYNLLLPCATAFSLVPPFVTCTPVATPFIGTFCDAGHIDLTLQLTPKSIGVTLLDLVLPAGSSPSVLVPLSQDLITEVPDFANAIKCLSSVSSRGFFTALSCATGSLTALATSPEELAQMQGVIARYALTVGAGAITDALKAVTIDLSVLIGDNIALAVLTNHATIPLTINGQ